MCSPRLIALYQQVSMWTRECFGNAMWWCRNTWVLIQVYLIGSYVTVVQYLCFMLKESYLKTATFPYNTEGNMTQNQIAMVTGATSGIGQAVAKKLIKLNYTVIAPVNGLPDNLIDKGVFGSATVLIDQQIAIEEPQKELFDYVKINLGSLSSVRTASALINQKYHHIDLLVNCAGIMFVPLQCNEVGLEDHFAVNFLGHFLLTHLSMPLLNSSSKSRIINVTSSLHVLGNNDVIENAIKPQQSSYSPHQAYANSKLALLLFTYKLHRQILPNVSTLAYDPGTVNTGLYRCTDVLTKNIVRWFGKTLLRSPDDAADDIITLIDADVPKSFSLYCGWLRSFKMSSSVSRIIELQNRLWDLSLKLCDLPS